MTQCLLNTNILDLKDTTISFMFNPSHTTYLQQSKQSLEEDTCEPTQVKPNHDTEISTHNLKTDISCND